MAKANKDVVCSKVYVHLVTNYRYHALFSALFGISALQVEHEKRLPVLSRCESEPDAFGSLGPTYLLGIKYLEPCIEQQIQERA